jgi:hypothetical protein
MPFAILGQVKGFKGNDSRKAIRLVKEGFSDLDEAEKEMTAIFSSPEGRSQYDDMYTETYRGESWQQKGGRCYKLALEAMLEQSGFRLSAFFPPGVEPRLVHGYCIGKHTDGKPKKTGHAWIEDDDLVLDCGSYVWSPRPQRKELYYPDRKVQEAYRYNRHEVEAAMEKYHVYYPWNEPPEDCPDEHESWLRLLEALQSGEL